MMCDRKSERKRASECVGGERERASVETEGDRERENERMREKE